MAAKLPDLYAVVEPFIGSLADGSPCEGYIGEVFAGDHPAVTRWPDFFKPLELRVRRAPAGAVEQATAAPGEKRGA